jgi:ribulose-5-phosphate 4-epimerase/fuculose-1-phosphate aldolase
MLDTICDVLKASYERRWISTRDGNASYHRKQEPYIYITPSGVRKNYLNSEMILKLRLPSTPITSECEDVFGECKRVHDEIQDKIIGLEPSGELMLHVLLQQIVPENRVVLHLHPTHIVAAMYAGLDLQTLAKEFPEINRYTRVGPTVPIIPPISRELAVASIEKLGLNLATGEVEFDIIGLDRHGVISIEKDAWSAYEHVERLDHICEIALAASSYKN